MAYQYKNHCYIDSYQALNAWVMDNNPKQLDNGNFLYFSARPSSSPSYAFLDLNYKEFQGSRLRDVPNIQNDFYLIQYMRPCVLETEQYIDLIGLSTIVLAAAFGVAILKRAIK